MALVTKLVATDSTDVYTISLKAVLSFLLVDEQENIMMPKMNHHWFQGHEDNDVKDLEGKRFFHYGRNIECSIFQF